ncbi:MAG: NYN domain-containing protein [Coriobacteriaceae bacterium]|nr:NYN domain-containing protein [Coriobacteriaceae bacterium]
MAVDTDMRFAVLIDADNVSEKYVKVVLDEVANAGVATYKRIYGDWTSPRLASWKGCLLDNSIIPMQQYSYTFGKNATDSAMIIDAMDILYSGTVDGFVIVSSDSDFTRLVARLRESGMVVIGMGEQKTPKPFISACNSFKYLDLLFAQHRAEEEGEDELDGPFACKSRSRRRRRPGDAGGNGELATSGQDGGSDVSDADSNDSDQGDDEVAFGEMSRADKRRHLRAIRSAINAIIDGFSDEDGWVSLGQLGDQLAKRLPDFDVRNYGYKRLRPFLKSLGVYEFDEPTGESGRRQIYVRLREQ